MSTVKAILGGVVATLLLVAGLMMRARVRRPIATDPKEAAERAAKREQIKADLAAARAAERERIDRERTASGGLAGYINRRK